MALVVFSYANPFADQLQLEERIFTIDGQLLRIEQAWKGDGKGGTDIGFGASVYPAAYVLAEYLERHPDLVRGKRVIELGTGTGFLGIAAAVLGAASVCLTDGDDGSLRLAERNVEANLPPTIGQHPRAPPRDRPAKETFKNTTTTNQSSSIASISCHNDNGMNTTRVIEVDRDDCAVTKAVTACGTPSENRRARVETGGAADPDASPRVNKPSSPPAAELTGVGKVKGNCAPPGAGALSVGAPSADALSTGALSTDALGAGALGAGALGAGFPESDARTLSSSAASGATIGNGNSVSVGIDCSGGGGGGGGGSGGGGGGGGGGGSGGGGSGDLGVEDHQHHQRQRAPRAVSVRKLRWGFPDDMEACLGKGGPWEVVLGSDIAALPYASAHGDLLRTIAFLVNGGSAAALDSENAAAEVHAENATEVERENGTELTVKNANKFEGENGTEFEVESGTKVQDESGVELHAEISTEVKGGGEREDEGPAAAERSRPRACRGGSRGKNLSDADSGASDESGADPSPPVAPPTTPSLPPSTPQPQQPRQPQRQPQQQAQRQSISPPVVLGKDRGGEGKGRKVLVLLAHKRRHVCEEPFFEGLRAELGESSCREMGEGDVHPDFRDMGIRLLAFEVDVCRRASGHKT